MRPSVLHIRRQLDVAAPGQCAIMVNSIFNGWRMEDVWLDKPMAALASRWSKASSLSLRATGPQYQRRAAPHGRSKLPADCSAHGEGVDPIELHGLVRSLHIGESFTAVGRGIPAN
jgi:hypothetical protein